MSEESERVEVTIPENLEAAAKQQGLRHPQVAKFIRAALDRAGFDVSSAVSRGVSYGTDGFVVIVEAVRK